MALLDLLSSLWDEFCCWADEAWHWLKQFFSKIFDWIVSWFNALYDYIADLLVGEDDEAVVVDTRTNVGSMIFQQIVEQCPEKTSIKKYDRSGKIVVGFDEARNIKKVENFQANHVEDANTDFDMDLARNGIIRMSN